MRELNSSEIDEVSGGIVPLLGLAVAAYSQFTATSFVGAMVARAGLGLAVYSAGEYLSDS